jgi:hypothetical protein
MYRIDEAKKRDAKLRWALPNRVFFVVLAIFWPSLSSNDMARPH